MSSQIKNHLIVAGVLVLGGIGYGWYELDIFSKEELVKMDRERTAQEQLLGKKESELRELQDFSANIERVKLELRELSLQLEAALEHMPKTFNLSGLLRRFTRIGQDSGLEVARFIPGKEEPKKAGGFYSSILIDMELQGTFTQTIVFLDQLSRLKRIMNVDNLKFNVAAIGSAAMGVMTNTVATVRTFRFAE